MTEEIGSWIELKFDNDYEIYDQYPYPIRKKSTGRILKESVTNGGYVRVCIKQKSQFKHRLIAFQWIENDDQENKTQIDHINRDKLDNRIENLRWVTASENNRNKDKYVQQINEYLDELPENIIEIREHEGLKFNNLYVDIDNERFLKITRSKIKIIKPYLSNKSQVISFTDIYGKTHGRSYQKLIQTFKKACDN